VRVSLHQNAVFAGAPRHVRGVGARHHRLGRGATVVHARAAELMLFNHGDFHAGAAEARGESRTGLAGADDQGIEGRRH
jgi:hypothetical protein